MTFPKADRSAHHACAPFEKYGCFLEKAVKCNGAHTGWDVARLVSTAPWTLVQAFARSAGRLLVGPVADIIEAYDSFCAAGADIFVHHFGQYNQGHTARGLLAWRDSLGLPLPDDDPSVAEAWWKRLWRMSPH